jgi:hypothetical protein
MGIVIIIGFLASYLQSKSHLDILFITIGIILVITGFYIQNEKTLTYFAAMATVNAFQWLVIIYTLLFIGQIYPFGDFLIFLSIAPLTTIIIYNRRRDQNSLDNHQKTKKDTILADKIRIVLISVGFLITLIFLASFLFSGSPLELFFSSVGLMLVVYGFYRVGKENIGATIEYTPGVSHLSMYRESKNVKVTVNYFLAMTSIIIFQLIIIYYIAFYYQSEARDMPFIFMITFWVSFFFYIQIRESDLKYIGKRKKKTQLISNKKKEMIIGIVGITLFVAIFGAYFLTGYSNDQPTVVRSTGGSFDNQWMSFNYPANWTLIDGSTNKHVNIYIYDGPNNQIGSIKDEDVSTKEYSDLKANKTIIDQREIVTFFSYDKNGILYYAAAFIFLTNSSSLHIAVSLENKEYFNQIINSIKIKK